jgi:hypothetical protein
MKREEGKECILTSCVSCVCALQCVLRLYRLAHTTLVRSVLVYLIIILFSR